VSSTFHIFTCPVCHSNQFNTFKEVPDWLVSKEVYTISQCNSCLFKFTSNAPTAENIGPYYNSEEYVEHSDTKSGVIYGVYHYARTLMLKFKLSKIKKNTSGKKLLDVGSGSGYFVNHMKQNGYEVTGVEISDKAVELCKTKFDIQAEKPEKFLAGKLDTDYDIISLWHVFEHVYTFDEYFSLFTKSLKKGGTLILALPNSDSADAKIYGKYWAAYDTPRHLWHFTPDTLSQFVEARGFTIVQKYRLPLDPFFNAMVSASYKPEFTFLPISVLKGLYSLIVSLFNKDRSSSLIYFLKKK
jgi:2-polyprenyl-3-methyl-5-hydroxy-6-metoxy-1,4-benzoquinol methylase